MLVAALASPNKTAEAALYLLEKRGATITDEVRGALLSKSSGGTNDPGIDTSTLVRWYTFEDDFVEGTDGSLLVANHAHLVNTNLSPEESQSLSVADDHEAPSITEKHGRPWRSSRGMALASKDLRGLPSGNEAYTVEIELTEQEGHGVAFFLGKPNRNSGCLGMWTESNGRKLHHFWWSNDCDKDGIDEETWQRGGDEDGEVVDASPWLKIAASWDPLKEERKIFVNGVMVHQDNAQGRGHDKPKEGDDDDAACSASAISSAKAIRSEAAWRSRLASVRCAFGLGWSSRPCSTPS